MSRIVAVVLFLFFAFAGAKSPSIADVDSVSDNAEAAAKLYLTAVEKLPGADVAGANARSVASLEADLVAETAAVAAALPCPECAHDYTALCPRGWSEASAGVCTAPGSYNAPCAAYAYFSAMSSADKMLFEKRCEVCWPCGAAAPIAPPSPSGPVAFTQVSSNARAPEHPTLNLHVVEPNDAAGARELEQESRDMKERLAQLESRRLDLKKRMASMMASVTQDIEDLLAMTGHAAKETKSVAFLASQVLPVDAYKIRNSLYLTQTMRGPAAASVNVISKEDVAKMAGEAKYKGMLEQTANILKSVKSDLRQMGTAKSASFLALRGASETATSKEVSALVGKVSAGGSTAKKALAQAIGMIAEPSAKSEMKVSGMEVAAAKLMSRPSTPVDAAGLAGSLITLLTDMPVTSTVSEEKTGSYGHVNVVVPRPSRLYGADEALLELASGVTPSSI